MLNFPFRMHPRAVAAVALVLSFASAPAWAANPLSLSEALRAAVNRSQLLVAQDAVAVAAREQAVAAGQWPDPVLKLGVDNLPVNGDDRFSLTNDFMTMRRIGFMQEIPRKEKRQLRGERLERDAQRAEAERNVALAAVQRNTAIAWLDRYYTLGLRDLVQQQLQETRLQVQSTEIAFASGRGNQADVFAARAAVIALEDKLSQADRQARGAELMLQRYVGDIANRLPDGPPPWRSVSTASAPARAHLMQHPDMQVQSALIDTARTEQQMAQADLQADWSVEVNYAQRGPAYANMLSFGVSIPLQLDQQNRQNRTVVAKQSLVLEAQARLDDMLLAHEAEQRVLQNDWENGKERLARFNDQLIPTAQQRTQAALVGYRAGKGDLAGVLAARREEIDTRVQALALEQETARIWAQLNYLTPDTSVRKAPQEQP